MIHIQILTLPMDPMSGHFDTRELDRLQQTKRITELPRVSTDGAACSSSRLRAGVRQAQFLQSK
jgi:hypothetical protein